MSNSTIPLSSVSSSTNQEPSTASPILTNRMRKERMQIVLLLPIIFVILAIISGLSMWAVLELEAMTKNNSTKITKP